MDMIPFEVFLKNIDLIPQQHTYYNGTIYIMYNVMVLSDFVESSGYYSKNTLKFIMSICAYKRSFTVFRT